LKDIGEGRTLAVPRYLRSSAFKGADQTEKGGAYQYSHDFEGNFVPQAYLPEGRRYYEPTGNGQEARIRERLEFWRRQFEAARTTAGGGS
jgi:putative ATPase